MTQNGNFEGLIRSITTDGWILAVAPAIDGCELSLRQLRNNIEATEHNLAGFAIEGNPIAFLDFLAGNFSAISIVINFEIATTDQTDLAELARDDRGMGGPPSDGGENAGRRRESRDIIGRRVVPH